MRGKIVFFVVFLSILVIGFFGSDSLTGAQILSSAYCKCTWALNPPYGYIGSLYEEQPLIESYIRVDNALQQTNCYYYCQSFKRPDVELVEAYPAGLLGQPPVSLTRKVY